MTSLSYDREALEAELIRDEGLRLKPYRCTSNKLTIGVGRNLDDRGVTREEALYLLHSDIKAEEAALDKHLPWWRTLSDARQRVLLNMSFNLGIKRLLGFKNTLGMIERGQYVKAADGMLESLWARQVGSRAERLAERMRKG